MEGVVLSLTRKGRVITERCGVLLEFCVVTAAVAFSLRRLIVLAFAAVGLFGEDCLFIFHCFPAVLCVAFRPDGIIVCDFLVGGNMPECVPGRFSKFE